MVSLKIPPLPQLSEARVYSHYSHQHSVYGCFEIIPFLKTVSKVFLAIDDHLFTSLTSVVFLKFCVESLHLMNMTNRKAQVYGQRDDSVLKNPNMVLRIYVWQLKTTYNFISKEPASILPSKGTCTHVHKHAHTHSQMYPHMHARTLT